MRMNPRAVALSLMLTAGLAAPALAQSMDGAMPNDQSTTNQPSTMNQTQSQLTGANVNPFRTTVPPLAISPEQKRHSAVCYLDDAVGLLDLSRQQLRAGNVKGARVALMGASGKLSTAYLLNFRDRAFSQRIEPLTIQVQTALNGDINAGLRNLDSLRGQVASIGQQQLAMLPATAAGGGGGGGGVIGTWQPIRFLAATPENTNQGLDQLNVPNQTQE